MCDQDARVLLGYWLSVGEGEMHAQHPAEASNAARRKPQEFALIFKSLVHLVKSIYMENKILRTVERLAPSGAVRSRVLRFPSLSRTTNND